MKHLLYLSLFLVFGQTFGQYVEIPDDNFRNFLKGKYATCFNSNDRMDTTCPEIMNETNMMISNLQIFDLEGLQYFDGLNGLFCHDNIIAKIPKIPTNLKVLVCSRNRIQKLPSIPDSVIYLACNSNQLTALPKLPNKLTHLFCDSNQLISLPTLPQDLVYLACNQNKLKKLPVLPANLSYLVANDNCFNEAPINPTPDQLITFNVWPNRPDCGLFTYLEKVSDDKYVVSYKKTTATDNGVNFLEYRCGTGYGTAELAAIADAHKRFTEFDDYKTKNLKRGVINARYTKDTVTYNETKYYLGDTIKIPKLDTLLISIDSRITDESGKADLRGNCFFYVQKATSNNSELVDHEVTTIEVPRKHIRYESRLITDYLYYFPNKPNPTTTKPNSKQQVLADFHLYYKDTTFLFNYLSYTCTEFKIDDSQRLNRIVKILLPRVDSLSLTIQNGQAQLKKLKLVYAQYKGNTPIADRTYIVLDSVTSFTNNQIKIINRSYNSDFMIMNPGDSVHYQLLAEFDTLQTPVIFQANDITFQTSMLKETYKSYYNDPYLLYLNSTIVSNNLIFSKSLTYCGNYKVKARIVGDTVHCQNTSKTFTANINANDKSLVYSWKYGTSFSSSPNFNVAFPTLGTRNMELTLTSKCGTDKAIQSMQTIATPAKPIISQVNNVLTSSASTGNQWYKDSKLLTDETNRSITVSSGGKYKVTVSNLCGSNTSNEISVILTENESAIIDDALQLYPNPASSQLFLNGSIEDCLAEIIHPNGTVMISKNMSNKNQIDISELPTGMYFFRLFDRQKNLKLTQKFLKN